jgi:transcription initiation factor TFIIB
MATASLYAAARKQQLPRSQSEFVDVSRVKKVRIQRAYRHLSRELGLEIEPEDPMQYIPKFVSSLAVSDEVEELSRELIEVMTQNAAHSGKSPAGLAAAAVYAAAYLTNEQLTQEEVSNTANVSKLTIRNRYQEILEVYGKHG